MSHHHHAVPQAYEEKGPGQQRKVEGGRLESLRQLGFRSACPEKIRRDGRDGQAGRKPGKRLFSELGGGLDVIGLENPTREGQERSAVAELGLKHQSTQPVGRVVQVGAVQLRQLLVFQLPLGAVPLLGFAGFLFGLFPQERVQLTSSEFQSLLLDCEVGSRVAELLAPLDLLPLCARVGSLVAQRLEIARQSLNRALQLSDFCFLGFDLFHDASCRIGGGWSAPTLQAEGDRCPSRPGVHAPFAPPPVRPAGPF
ncbi:hypothetical protein [Caulobacter sp. SL161]|uniref:hypothetical protein n=1 Tax=Caulobacter sp. SL161 TaxID=2995156 RepID=UPI003FA3AE24